LRSYKIQPANGVTIVPKNDKRTLYSLHPGFAMEASSMANLVQRTGKPLDEWIKIVTKTGPAGSKERREWLKAEHGITTNYAMWIVDRAEGNGGADSYDPEGMVEKMYSGPKETLRPIYDALLSLGLGLAEDVKACPCETIVPLYRKHVFAQIKPTTQTRIDMGFALKDTPATGRLIDTGGFAKKDRITHRIPITSVEEIDDEVKRWLQTAYEMDK
jgi:hypothetical protein